MWTSTFPQMSNCCLKCRRYAFVVSTDTKSTSCVHFKSGCQACKIKTWRGNSDMRLINPKVWFDRDEHLVLCFSRLSQLFTWRTGNPRDWRRCAFCTRPSVPTALCWADSTAFNSLAVTLNPLKGSLIVRVTAYTLFYHLNAPAAIPQELPLPPPIY